MYKPLGDTDMATRAARTTVEPSEHCAYLPAMLPFTIKVGASQKAELVPLLVHAVFDLFGVRQHFPHNSNS
jgi:hypothetical protein